MLLPFDLMHTHDPRSVGLPLPEGEGWGEGVTVPGDCIPLTPALSPNGERESEHGALQYCASN